MWVARNGDGTISLHATKPIRMASEDYWISFDDSTRMFKDLFPDLKWESEPLEVELKAVKS